MSPMFLRVSALGILANQVLNLVRGLSALGRKKHKRLRPPRSMGEGISRSAVLHHVCILKLMRTNNQQATGPNGLKDTE